MHLPVNEVPDVLAANLAFYDAFQSLDLAAMEAVWSQGPRVKCIHPGWDLLTGWEAIRASWEAIFQHTSEIHVELHDVVVEVKGSLAWVVLVEEVTSRSLEGESAGAILATNIFEKENGRWLLVHHHASPLPPRPQELSGETVH